MLLYFKDSCFLVFFFFFFKQKTAYEMRISDWSSDVCYSDLGATTSMTRPIRFVELVSSLSRSVGLIGVSLSKSTRSELDSGSAPLTESICTIGLNFSLR